MAIKGASWLADRGTPATSLALPLIGGLAYMAAFGAPATFLTINALALCFGLLWISFGRLPNSLGPRRALAMGLVVLIAAPVTLGPSADGVTRWLAIGGFTLHAGMVAVPLLVRLLANDRAFGPWLTLVAILIAFAQPDSATALALTAAALGAGIATHSTALFAITGLGLAAAIGASFNGDLPPQPFAESILSDLWSSYPLAALALAASLLGTLLLVSRLRSLSKAERFAICGALSGFIIAALNGDYPYPLIGFGAAPVVGLGLALARTGDQSSSVGDPEAK